MAVTRRIAIKRGFPKAEKATLQERVVAVRQGFLPILTPLIILAGILFSIVSPTEAAVLAVFYSLFLGIFILKHLKLKDLPNVFQSAALNASTILLVIGSAAMFGWVLTITRVPYNLANLILNVTSNKYLFLFIINVFLLFIGMFLDAGPAILILGPILGPTLMEMDINATHFAIVMCVNLTVGLATPPFGLVLFAASTVSKLPMGKIVKQMIPYWGVHFSVILILTFIPEISLFLPRILGLPV